MPEGDKNQSSLAPPSSFNTSIYSSHMSDANQVGDEQHHLPNFHGQKEVEIKGPGSLIPKSGQSEAMKNLQKLK